MHVEMMLPYKQMLEVSHHERLLNYTIHIHDHIISVPLATMYSEANPPPLVVLQYNNIHIQLKSTKMNLQCLDF